MKKLLLSSTLLTLLFVTDVYGKAKKYERSGSTQDTEQMKFGAKLKLHTAMLRSNIGDIIAHLTFRPSFDLFGEYTLNDGLGVQLSLGYSGQGTKWTSLNTSTPQAKNEHFLKFYYNYIMLSVIPRFYPGSDRQFCFFIGPRVSWLASAKSQEFVGKEKKGKEIDLLGKEALEKAKPKRIDFGILWGLDYEFDTGILLGADFNVGLTNLVKKELESKVVMKTFSMGITLGYNFAKLFN